MTEESLESQICVLALITQRLIICLNFRVGLICSKMRRCKHNNRTAGSTLLNNGVQI